MKKYLKPQYRLSIFLCAIVFNFIIKIDAQSSSNSILEGDMVKIPAGSFLYGTNKKDKHSEAISLGLPKAWYADEGPEQSIFLKTFYIDRYEVTNERYKAYIDDLNAVVPSDWTANSFPIGRKNYPVINISWYDAANFCQWAEKKLPSEKQWEKAARGGTNSKYPWGNEFQITHANLSSKSGSRNSITSVGSYPKGITPLGVHDMIGNVWEWIDDDYSPYKGSTYQSKYFGGGFKVLRGQSAKDIGHFPGASYLSALKMFSRNGYRDFLNADQSAIDVGFRCVSSEMPKAAKLISLNNKVQPRISSEILAKTEKQLQTNPFEVKSNLPQSGMLILIFLAFTAGIFSFLSPCTLPILPAYFAVTAQADRARMGFMSVAFFLGLATLFVGMGASASFFGGLLREYMFSLTKIGGIIVIIFGIMTLFGKGFSGAGFQGRPASTFFGFFLFGATFALGWTPCVGPILSGILILAAADKTIFQGMLLLFFYAVGLGVPLIFIATLCGNLPKDGLFWTLLRGKGWSLRLAGNDLLLHSTNIFSGLLLIILGIALTMGYITYINSLIPIEIQIWFSVFEEKVLHFFMPE